MPELRVSFEGLETLSADTLALFGRDGVFSTLGWYRTTIGFALPKQTQGAFVVVADGEDPLAVFPMQCAANGHLSALTTPYTCLWQPLFAAAVHESQTLFHIGKAFGTWCRARATLRLDAMDAEAPWLPPLLKGMRAGGILPLPFDHFGNWHEDVVSWDAYLAGRPGALREAIRRRGGKLEKRGACLSVVSSLDGLDLAIAAYEKIYAMSWKETEPFALFNAALMRACVEDRSLRLGFLNLDGQPIAVQFWVVREGWAGVLKLAHDEDKRALSPGTVLTAWMIRRLLDEDHVTSLDFGRGDDDYKKDWVGARRQRIGFLLANPRSIAGAVAVLRHAVSKARRRFKVAIQP